MDAMASKLKFLVRSLYNELLLSEETFPATLTLGFREPININAFSEKPMRF